MTMQRLHSLLVVTACRHYAAVLRLTRIVAVIFVSLVIRGVAAEPLSLDNIRSWLIP